MNETLLEIQPTFTKTLMFTLTGVTVCTILTVVLLLWEFSVQVVLEVFLPIYLLSLPFFIASGLYWNKEVNLFKTQCCQIVQTFADYWTEKCALKLEKSPYNAQVVVSEKTQLVFVVRKKN